MSFILDALKKSETDRQQQGAAEFAGVPTSSGPTRAPRWLWFLGLLLAVNLAVLLGLFMRPETRVASVDVEASPPPAAEDTTTEQSFVERVAEARRNAPPPEEAAPREEVALSREAAPDLAPRTEVAPPVNEVSVRQVTQPTSANVAALPTFVEVLTSGTIQIPELRIDIHVYSETAKDRFVFINMSKYREQSQLSEGPVVEEIAPDGVVLNYQGTSFFLPRD